MSIYEKLYKIQGQLKAPKSQRNEFGNFNYRSAEDILEALKPLLQQEKAVLLFTDDVVVFGSRFYIKATVSLWDTEANEHVSVSAYARETDERPKMDAAQVTGSASSYARKYALNAMFCIDDSKDPDALPPAEKPREKTITQTEVHQLQKAADKKGVPYTSICGRYGKKDIRTLSEMDFRRAMAVLSKMPDRFPDIPDDIGELPFR